MAERDDSIVSLRDVHLTFERPILRGVNFDLAAGTTKVWPTLSTPSSILLAAFSAAIPTPDRTLPVMACSRLLAHRVVTSLHCDSQVLRFLAISAGGTVNGSGAVFAYFAQSAGSATVRSTG